MNSMNTNSSTPIANYKGIKIYVSQNPNWKYYADNDGSLIGIGDRYVDHYFDIIGYYNGKDTLDDKIRTQYYNTHPDTDNYGSQQWFTAQILYPMNIEYNHKFLIHLPDVLKHNLQSRIWTAEERKNKNKNNTYYELSTFKPNYTHSPPSPLQSQSSNHNFGYPSPLSQQQNKQQHQHQQNKQSGFGSSDSSVFSPQRSAYITSQQLDTKPTLYSSLNQVITPSNTSEFSAFNTSQPKSQFPSQSPSFSTTSAFSPLTRGFGTPNAFGESKFTFGYQQQQPPQPTLTSTHSKTKQPQFFFPSDDKDE